MATIISEKFSQGFFYSFVKSEDYWEQNGKKVFVSNKIAQDPKTKAFFWELVVFRFYFIVGYMPKKEEV